MNAIIKYYDDIRDVIIPYNFDNFRTSLAEMLGIDIENLSDFLIFYKVNDNIFYLKSSENYLNLIEKLKNNETTTIEIEFNNYEEDNQKKDDILSKSKIVFHQSKEKEISNLNFNENKNDKLQNLNIDNEKNNFNMHLAAGHDGHHCQSRWQRACRTCGQ